MLRNVRIVDDKDIDNSKVQVGHTVILNDIEFDEKIEYKIVGPAEANVTDNKISYESPLGKGLIGKGVGDVISVEAPVGTVKYELLEIK